MRQVSVTILMKCFLKYFTLLTNPVVDVDDLFSAMVATINAIIMQGSKNISLYPSL